MEEIKVNTHIYQIIRLLGKGKGGYTYLAIFQGKKYALKKIHHEPCEYYTFGDKLESELKDYQKLKGMGILMPELIEVDKDQEIIIKEYLEGDTVFEMVKKGEDISRCLDEMKKMCEILYTNNTNIDYFPTNFIYRDGLYYVDYECNNYMDEWNFENWGIKYWSKTAEFMQYLKDNGYESNND